MPRLAAALCVVVGFAGTACSATNGDVEVDVSDRVDEPLPPSVGCEKSDKLSDGKPVVATDSPPTEIEGADGGVERVGDDAPTDPREFEAWLDARPAPDAGEEPAATLPRLEVDPGFADCVGPAEGEGLVREPIVPGAPEIVDGEVNPPETIPPSVVGD